MAVADAIKELGEVPSGHLYARLMAHGCTLENFESIVRMLTRSDLTDPLVIKRGDLLYWNSAAYPRD